MRERRREGKPASSPSPAAQPAATHAEEKWPLIACAALLLFVLMRLYGAPKFYTAMGELYEEEGRLVDAVHSYDRVLAVWPRLFDANEVLIKRAVLLMSTEGVGSPRHADTEADLRAALKVVPENANANFNLAVVLSELVDGGARAAEAVLSTCTRAG